MTDDIRIIVNGYIIDGDYEKALSLMQKFPLEEEQDKELFQQCAKEFTTHCTSAIAEAVKTSNKEKAEQILSAYKKLIGEDANTQLFQTLVDGIIDKSGKNTSSVANVVSGIHTEMRDNLKYATKKISEYTSISISWLKKTLNKAAEYKKQIGIGAASVIGVIILIGVGVAIKNNHDKKVAEEQAIERARQESIRAAEQARLAAIEQARQDSIAAVRRREQAIKDSIDYAEHAGFVAKYAKIGLIITNIQMTRGKNDDGIPSKGIKFTVFNPTHKTIKYVIADMHAVNRFNDRVSYNERCRGMGPVDSHEYGSWDFEDVFPDKNDIIDDLKVSFQVVYTNGTSRSIRWKDAYVEDFKTSWFYGR